MPDNGRENLWKAICFASPSYLPVLLGVDLDWLAEKDERKRARIRDLIARFPSDLMIIDAIKDREPPTVIAGIRRWVDEWGVP